jgi:uroporphyrinogen-III synthase
VAQPPRRLFCGLPSRSGRAQISSHIANGCEDAGQEGCNSFVTKYPYTLHKILLIPTSCAKRFYCGHRKLLLDKLELASYGCSMATSSTIDDSSVDFLHELGTRMASADALHEVLARVVDFASALVKCDSCLIYVLEGDELLLRASKNPHPEVVDRLKLRVGEGITGWVAEHREPVAVSKNASKDSRFQFFHELPEDTYEAFLSVPLMSRGRVVGVINLQHRRTHAHNQREIRLISTVGFLVGAEIEMARLETENTHLSQKLETRKIVERAKGILQRDLSLDEEQAYLALQRQSRQTRKSMREVAEAVVVTDEVRRSSRAI